MDKARLLLKNSLWALAIYFIQLFLANWISINSIRPDFFAIFLIYFTIRWGSFYGIIYGFIFGLLLDFAGAGSSFGLSAILYVMITYSIGFLSVRVHNISPLYLTLGSFIILTFAFLIDSLFRYPILFDANVLSFLLRWISVSAYTLGFMSLLQYFIPLRRVVIE